MILHVGNCRLELAIGDITRQQVDAIANAANAQLAGGGGVDGAIHRAAGPSLMRETQEKYPRGCAVGDAVLTSAGQLLAKFVLHAVGPVWRGGMHQEPALLSSAYRRCLELAREQGCTSLAFPAISTGVYGYPKDLAAQISLDTVRAFLLEHQQPELVRFVLFDEGSYGAYARVLEQYLG